MPALDRSNRCRQRQIGRMVASSLATLCATAGMARAETAFGPVAVAVTAKACEPNELKVPAGLVTFLITNKSSRALEFEILNGVMVVDERENIAPGFKQKLTSRLQAGTYEITCGFLDNPHGKLVVTEAGTTTEITKPSAVDLIGPIAEIRVGTATTLAALDPAVQRLDAAMTAGDVAAAKTSFIEARGLFLQMSPIFGSIASDAAPVTGDFAAIDQALFDHGSLDGLATVQARMTGDVAAFHKAARALVPSADRLMAGATATAHQIVNLLDGSTPTSASALAEIDDLQKSLKTIVARFAPLAGRTDASLPAQLTTALDQLGAGLQRTAGPVGGHADVRALSEQARRDLLKAASTLEQQMERLPAALGL